jgi:hypothetical protein
LFFKWASAGAAALALLATADVMRRFQPLDGSDRTAGLAPAAVPGAGMQPISEAHAPLFQVAESGIPRASPTNLNDLFRLVGVMMDPRDDWKSTAFIENKSTGTQRRYRPGDQLTAEFILQSIAQHAVWIRGPSGLISLVREGETDVVSGTDGMAGTPADDGVDPARFGGRQSGGNTWIFKRQVILDYYQELLDRPERLVKVFDSLAPVYNEDRKIEGYRVQIEGESDFFKAIDLRPGDIVRKVNEIEMTNRYRAENLIRRFAQRDLDVVVIDLDRDGKSVQQIYHTE